MVGGLGVGVRGGGAVGFSWGGRFEIKENVPDIIPFHSIPNHSIPFHVLPNATGHKSKRDMSDQVSTKMYSCFLKVY